MRQNTKLIIFLLFSLLILVPASYAADNDTILLNDNSHDTATVSISNDDVLKASNDYYFNASADSDGDGSITNPYKYLYASRIKANSNLYFADGQYNLDTSRTVEEVNIIGSNVDKTIINYDGVAFTANTAFSVKNITFVGSSITNHGKLTAYNTIFKEGFGSKPDSYGNNFGGAIYTYDENQNAHVTVDNCTFSGNYAEYGGAIYMGAGVLEVSNSLFNNNYAYNYGGDIACEVLTNVSVSNSKFYNSRSLNDAGGSIYIKKSKFIGTDIEIINSSATFGGAITTLKCDVALTGLNIVNCSAKYDGGAIFHMYGNFTLLNSKFDDNSAVNGGALFIDNSTNAFIRSNIFTNNHANNTAGAIYSLLNKLSTSFTNNRFISNSAEFQNNYYVASKINLTIGSGNYTMYNVGINPNTNLPSRYSLVDEGYTTIVKDQQTSGNCWAFAAISVLESCILKAGGDSLDLSEENMKNIIALYSDYGWQLETNEGGFDEMTFAYLASWLGPVYEEEDLFDDHSVLSAVLNSVMHVQNIKLLKHDSYLDTEDIKRSILNYGAVGASFYYDSGCFNSATNGYCCYSATYGNHAVVIVGWDDSYSKTNFKYGGPEGDGAWIVRNSWNTNWGDNGYFYISYYDRTFGLKSCDNAAYAIILNDTIKYDKNYQYDIQGLTDIFLNSSSTVWYKNVFTATDDEYLAAVSTYFDELTNWTASVNVNGQLKDVISGIASPGYFTFNLNKLVPLKRGDVFEVIFNVTFDGEAHFPISESIRFNKITYYPGISFVSYDGENWSDLYNLTWQYSSHIYSSQVACIKAFTVLNPINTFLSLNVNVVNENLLNITAKVTDEYGNLVNYGNVTFNINGENEVADVVGGIASVIYSFNQKTNYISAVFGADGYNPSSDSMNYTIPKIKLKWNLMISKSYNNADINVLTNSLINEKVKVIINGDERLVDLINGKMTLKLENLSNDVYQVYISLLDDSEYEVSPLVGEFFIDLFKTSIVSDNLTVSDVDSFAYNVTLLDQNNLPIANREIIFNINNSNYYNVTDENGQALINLNLKKGVYDVDIVFDGDNDYFKSYSKNTIKVKGNVWINLDINAFDNNAFIHVFASGHLNELITVLVNDKQYYVDSNDGVAVLKLNDLSDGVYNVSVMLDNDEYDFNEASSQFTIQYGQKAKINTDVSIVDGNAIINVEVENATGEVNLIVDGVVNVISLKDSKITHTIENISSGNHSLVIIYMGTDFVETLKSEVFYVAKKQSNVDLIVNDMVVGEKSTIIVEVSPDVTGFVSLDINGSYYLVDLSKTNKLSVEFNNPGDYFVIATYLGDDNYNSSVSDVYRLVVNDKLMPNISVGVPDVVKVGQTVQFNVSIDASCVLQAFIDGVSYDIADGTISYTALSAGTHNVIVESLDNAEYYGTNSSLTFEVVKNEAFVFVDMADIVFVGDNVTIIPVTNSNGKLNVTVNGQVVDSSYVIPFKGTFVLKVETGESEMYYSAVNSTTFTAVKHSSTITINATAGKPGEKSAVDVFVDDGATGIVLVNINGLNYAIDLADTSKLELVLNPGEYSVFATYLGDDKYNSSVSGVYELVVNDKLVPDISVGVPDVVKVGQTVQFNISSDASCVLEAFVDGVKYDIVDGTISYTALSAGAHTVRVEVSESDMYYSAVNSTTFTAVKQSSTIKINATAGEKSVVDVFVDGGATGIVIVSVGDFNYAINLADTSKLELVLNPGEYSVSAVYLGDDKYDSSISEKISLIIPARLASNFNVEYFESIKTYVVDYSAGERAKAVDFKLTDSNGNPVSNASVTFSYKNKIINAITDAEGIVHFAIESESAGQYYCVLSYRGDETHNATFVPFTFNLQKKPITITAKAKTYKASLKTKKYTITLKTQKCASKNAKTYLKSGKKVTLKLNGKTYTAKINAKGKATFSLKITKKGKYTATIKFAGDKTYNSVSKKVKITIK